MDEALVLSLESDPYEYDLKIKDASPGDHVLEARAVDDKGKSSSGVIEIRVLPDPGEFQDPRDGHIYRFVTIGDQIWMIDNLAYLPSVISSKEKSDSTAVYYVLSYNGNEIPEATGLESYVLYGALYNWEAAKCSCPEGWHLTTNMEWQSLVSFIESGHGRSTLPAIRHFRSGGALPTIYATLTVGKGIKTGLIPTDFQHFPREEYLSGMILQTAEYALILMERQQPGGGHPPLLMNLPSSGIFGQDIAATSAIAVIIRSHSVFLSGVSRIIETETGWPPFHTIRKESLNSK